MCQKTNITKRFFLLLNHPPPLQKPLVMKVLKETPFTTTVYDQTRNTIFLSNKHLLELEIQPPKVHQAYMLPIDIPRDWFIH